jgi:hypothetical protein
MDIDMSRWIIFHKRSRIMFSIRPFLAVGLFLCVTAKAQAPEDIQGVDLTVLQQRAQAKDPVAQAELCGRLIFGVRGSTKDPSTGLVWCHKAGDGRKGKDPGNAQAQAYLGLAYLNGLGVPVDLLQSIMWFRKSAEGGSALGQLQLGMAYLYGNGISVDDQEAVKWLLLSTKEFSNAYNILPDAETKLADQYATGRGRDVDYGQAAHYYALAADRGNTDALTKLGAMYMSGRGVPWSDDKAKELFKRSAAKGDAQAVAYLAKMYKEASDRAAYIEPVRVAPSPSELAATAAESKRQAEEDYQNRLRQHDATVADLRREVVAADAAAEEAEAEAQKAKQNGENATATGSGITGALTIALTGGSQALAENQAQKKRAQADALRDKLRELGEVVIQPPALANSMDGEAGRDRIAEARDRNIANISAAAAPAQAQAHPSAFTFGPPEANGGGTHVGGNDGTVKPPIVTPVPSPPTTTRVLMTCPASGFIPGVMKQSGDTAVGVPCTPGQPIRPTPSPAPPASGAGLTLAQPLDRCVTQLCFLVKQ